MAKSPCFLPVEDQLGYVECGFTIETWQAPIFRTISPVMRRIAMVTVFCVLAVATVLWWNHRYEMEPGSVVVRADDGKSGGFQVTKNDMKGSEIVLIAPLPFETDVSKLHVRLSVSPESLVRGGEKWKDGRLILDWFDRQGRIKAHDTLATMQGTEKKSRTSEMIVRGKGKGVYPVLRVEHLGLSGSMRIHTLQFRAVRDRVWSGWVAAVLSGAWAVWSFYFARSFAEHACWRPAGVAIILVTMGWLVVVPGQAEHKLPLAGHFQLGNETAGSVRVIMEPGFHGVYEAKPLGNMPMQGGWLLWLRKTLETLRPLLHLLLFAGPAAFITVLCGRRCALFSGILMSCLLEGAQVGYGYGFDWADVMDLVLNCLGIFSGIMISVLAMKRWSVLRLGLATEKQHC